SLATAWRVAVPTPVVQQQAPSAEDIQKMLEGAKKWTAPVAAHDKLKRFVGKWDVSHSMMGMTAGKSTATFTSILGGRFVKEELDGQFMRMPYEGLGLLGYDNFKQAYTMSWLDNQNTYKLDSQGKFDQSGNTLIFYGTLDEYLTGENDKPIKYVFRFTDDDHFVMELHDLAIGETNTKVYEMHYSRAK